MGRWPCYMNLGRLRFPRYDHKRKRKSWPIFSIEEKDRARHFWILGKSGFGKSTFLENTILQDIRKGNGLALFDPHGDLAENVLSLIPPRRRKDVVLFDPSDHHYPIGFNLLYNVPIERRPFVAASILDNFRTIFKLEQTPLIDMFVLAAAAAQLDFPSGTILGMKYMLNSEKYRRHVIGHIRDPVVKRFWEDFDQDTPDKQQREDTRSTLNKMFQLAVDPSIRNIIGQPKSRLSFTDIMDSKKIFIASLRQGDLGIQKSSLIGSLLISSLHLAALQRSAQPHTLPPLRGRVPQLPRVQ